MCTLADRQIAFAKHYAATDQGAESARAAAHHLLRRSHVVERLSGGILSRRRQPDEHLTAA